MYKFSYNIVTDSNVFATDLPTRSLARAQLKEVKALGYKDARIIREEYIKVNERQIR